MLLRSGSGLGSVYVKMKLYLCLIWMRVSMHDVIEGGLCMEKAAFRECIASQNNSNWDKHIERKSALYSRPDDIRSPFARELYMLIYAT